MEGKSAKSRVAMRPDRPRALRDTSEGRLENLVEAAKSPIQAKVEYSFWVIKQQLNFQKARLRGMNKSLCKINGLTALINLFLARRQLLLTM